MGKGDRKTRKGKIFMGTYGNTRKRKNNKLRKYVVKKAHVVEQAETAPVVAEPVVTEVTETAKPKVKKAPRKRIGNKKEKPEPKSPKSKEE